MFRVFFVKVNFYTSFKLESSFILSLHWTLVQAVCSATAGFCLSLYMIFILYDDHIEPYILNHFHTKPRLQKNESLEQCET